MTRYDTIIDALKRHVSDYDNFEQRGKNAAVQLIKCFSEYLEVPNGCLKVAPPGSGFNTQNAAPPEYLVKLTDDGYFGVVVIVRERNPLGVMLGTTVLVRVLEDSFILKRESEDQEFRVKEITSVSCEPFFGHIVASVLEYLSTSPERLSSGRKRPIGFVWNNQK